MTVAPCWIRRDLRLVDNDARHAALDRADQVLLDYVLAAVHLERYAGTERVAFLFDTIRQRDADLRALGGRLLIRRGDAGETHGGMVQETGATAVFPEED